MAYLKVPILLRKTQILTLIHMTSMLIHHNSDGEREGRCGRVIAGELGLELVIGK